MVKIAGLKTMEMDKIIQMINDLAADVFDSPGIQLKLSDSSSNIKGWDSLTQVVLVTEIEKQFDIRFSFKDLASIMNIGDIINVIKNKTKGDFENET